MCVRCSARPRSWSTAPARTGIDTLRDIGKADVCSRSRSIRTSAARVETARYAKSRGARIVAITDSDLSPLAAFADRTVLVSHRDAVLLSTMAPAFAAVECLAALVAARRGDETLAALARSEQATRGARHLCHSQKAQRSNHDTHPSSHDRPRLSGCRQRAGHLHPRRQRQGLSRCVGRRGGLVPRPFASRRARGVARAARHPRICAYELLHDARRRGTGRRPRQACARRHRSCDVPLRRLGGDRSGAEAGAAIFRRDAASRSGAFSLRGSRAITASRSARSRSAAAHGSASNSGRC